MFVLLPNLKFFPIRRFKYLHRVFVFYVVMVVICEYEMNMSPI